jgi:glycerophosphoryl diester phosphodiesterase
MPLVSENYGRVLRWKGEGPFPDEEMNRLQTLTRRAHAQGKRVRLWASPEREDVWKTLLQGGADLISTDQLERLNKFLLSLPEGNK